MKLPSVPAFLSQTTQPNVAGPAVLTAASPLKFTSLKPGQVDAVRDQTQGRPNSITNLLVALLDCAIACSQRSEAEGAAESVVMEVHDRPRQVGVDGPWR